MTDKKAERLLNYEADAIIDENREKILERCGVREKQCGTGRKVLKVLAIAASFAFIAALAYVCYLPVYMKDHGLLPASGETDTAEGSTAPVTSETGSAPSSAEEPPADPAIGQTIIRIEEYMKSITLPDDSGQALERIYYESAKLCMSGDRIIIPKTDHTENFVRINYLDPDCMTYDTNNYFVENLSCIFADPLQCYLVFLSSVETFEDYYVDAKPDLMLDGDITTMEYLIFSTEYKKSGYDNILDYVTDHLIGDPRDAFEGYKVSYRNNEVKKLPKDSENAAVAWYSDIFTNLVAETGEFYYGICNGYSVRLIPGVLTANSNIDIGGYSFKYGSSFQLKAEKDGIEYDLKEIYDKGYLTEDDIVEINMVHRERFESYYCSELDVYRNNIYKSAFAKIKNNTADSAEFHRLVKLFFKMIYGPEREWTGRFGGYELYNNYFDLINLIVIESGSNQTLEITDPALVCRIIEYIKNLTFVKEASYDRFDPEQTAAWDTVKYLLTMRRDNVKSQTRYFRFWIISEGDGFAVATDYFDMKRGTGSDGLTVYHVSGDSDLQGLIDFLSHNVNRAHDEGTDPVEEITLPDYSEYKDGFALDSFLVRVVIKSDGADYTVQDFPELELTRVRKLMDLNDDTSELVMYLKNPGKDNVLEAIKLMLARDDVRSAEPNFLMTPAD